MEVMNNNIDREYMCVGIGASASGLEALEKFFKSLPDNTGFAYVVIQHLSPDTKSIMDEILSKYTPMPVVKIKNHMQVKPDHVYVLPPGYSVTILNNILTLEDIVRDRSGRKPIDKFFQSLALDKKDKAVGIILAGAGTDGTEGINEIKSNGGIVIVQDPQTAEFDSMPTSAIKTGHVDYIAEPTKIASDLIDYVMGHTETSIYSFYDKEDIYQNILETIKKKTNHDFSDYKPNTIIRRINKRMIFLKINNLDDYLEYLEKTPEEATILMEELLIGVTGFFRDPEAFQVIKTNVIPEIFKNKSPGDEVRVWSVGCSTGEEAYSLAILFKEYMEENKLDFFIKVFATDIDKRYLAKANLGFYKEEQMKDVPEKYLKKYFNLKNNGYEIKDFIRKMVIFSLHDIINNPPFLNIDLISCRNLLIYFKSYPQRKILASLHFSIKSNGFLFLGKSESLGDFIDSYNIIGSKWKIYQCKNKDNRALMKELFLTTPPREGKTIERGNYPRVNVLPTPYLLEDEDSENFCSSLLDIYMPPGVVVTESCKIVQIFQNVNPYIRFKPGKLSLNAIKLAHSEISGIMANIIKKIFAEKKEVEYKNIQFEEEGELYTIDIKGIFIKGKSVQNYAVITFHRQGKVSVCSVENDKEQESSAENFDLLKQYKIMNESLKQKLKLTEESLQSTVDELETANEELQSTNEELISSNEELQSTNEELQSLNEELYTINAEYQKKIEELTCFNEDMNNLLNNVGSLGMLLLDDNLNIKRFTKDINNVINIKPSDIKRPISDISLNVGYDNLIDDIKDVSKTNQVKEREIKDKINNKWYLIKISPYITTENEIEGTLIITLDITKQKNL